MDTLPKDFDDDRRAVLGIRDAELLETESEGPERVSLRLGATRKRHDGQPAEKVEFHSGAVVDTGAVPPGLAEIEAELCAVLRVESRYPGMQFGGKLRERGLKSARASRPEASWETHCGYAVVKGAECGVSEAGFAIVDGRSLVVDALDVFEDADKRVDGLADKARSAESMTAIPVQCTHG